MNNIETTYSYQIETAVTTCNIFRIPGVQCAHIGGVSYPYSITTTTIYCPSGVSTTKAITNEASMHTTYAHTAILRACINLASSQLLFFPQTQCLYMWVWVWVGGGLEKAHAQQPLISHGVQNSGSQHIK